MKKLIEIPGGVVLHIESMPGTATAVIKRLLLQSIIPSLPVIYDVKKVDLTKIIFLIMLRDFNYIREKIGVNMRFSFRKEYTASKIGITFEVDYDTKQCIIISSNAEIDNIECEFDKTILLNTFYKIVNFNSDNLKLLTISDKRSLVPNQWLDDEYFMSFFEKNHLNSL